MDIREVAAFFDDAAATWDDHLVRDDKKISRILELSDIKPGCRVLDVACGTGVLFPYYLHRGAAQITGADISARMIERAKAKFLDPRIALIECDIICARLPQSFDRCVVYNALPHFVDPSVLISKLCSFLAPNGRLTFAHSMSREHINRHHSGAAAHISRRLMPSTELSRLMPSHCGSPAKNSRMGW